MSRPVCVTFAWGSYLTWDLLYKNCLASFKKWHPDIEVRIFGDKDYDGDVSKFTLHESSMWRFEMCRKLFEEGYTKVILIGLDTFTCARWTEILEDNTSPVIATLSGPYMFDSHDVKHQHLLMPMQGWFENKFVGYDLTCYNSRQALEDVIRIQEKYKRHDNHSLNVYVNEINPNAARVVDFPYIFSPFVYNGLASWPGCLAQQDCIMQDGSLRWGFDGPVIGKFSPTTRYLPVGDKLYNHVGKHIKAFSFDKTITKDRMHQYLNKETIEWLKTYCDIDMYI